MKKQCFLLILLLAVTFGVNFMAPVAWGDVGSFQALKLSDNAIFIMDTKSGHLWLWLLQVDPEDEQHRQAEFLLYQGQVVPAEKMGTIIERTYPPKKGRFLEK